MESKRKVDSGQWAAASELPFVIRHSCFAIIALSLALSGLSSPLLRGEEPSVAERQRVESMSPGEKAELLRKKELFDKLSAADREKLRRLHEDLQNDGDSEELRRIMHDYYEWWKMLPLSSRAELSSISSPKERVKKIMELKQDELRRDPLKNLSKEDADVLREWTEKYAKKFEDTYQEYQKSLSKEKRADWDAKSPQQRRWEVMRFIAQQWQKGGNKSPPVPDDLAALRSKLTPEIQKILEAKQPAEQWRTISEWLHLLARRDNAARKGRNPGSLVDEKDLEEFFKSGKIDPNERERLLNLPPEQMHNQLQQLYLSKMKSFEPFFPRPGGPPLTPPGGPRGNPEWMKPNKPEKMPEKTE